MPWSSTRLRAALALTFCAAVALTAPGAKGASPTPTPTGTPDSAERPVQLLRASFLAPQSVSYVGQLETLRFGVSRAQAMIVRVEHLAPDLTRRWYVAPEAVYGDYTITRGITTFEYDTKHSRVVTSRNPALQNQLVAADSLSLVLQNYRAVMASEETVAGRKADSVLLINKHTGERVVRVWIDDATNLVLKKEEYRPNGSVAAESRFEEIRYTGSIPRDVFSTAIPAGYARVAGRDYASPSNDVSRAVKEAGFKPIVPKYLPEGFALVSADVGKVNDVKTLHFLYSDGIRGLSLFENATGAAADFGKMKPQSVTFDGHDAQYVEDGPTTLLAWEERDRHFALVSDLALRDMVEIATSVVP